MMHGHLNVKIYEVQIRQQLIKIVLAFCTSQMGSQSTYQFNIFLIEWLCYLK